MLDLNSINLLIVLTGSINTSKQKDQVTAYIDRPSYDPSAPSRSYGNLLDMDNTGTPSGVLNVSQEEPPVRPSWLAEMKVKVDSFRALSPGWDSYEAASPNAWSRYYAGEVLTESALLSFRPARVAASVEGGIVVAWNLGGKKANIEIFNSGEILAAIRDVAGRPVVWEIEGNDFSEALKTIRDYIGQ